MADELKPIRRVVTGNDDQGRSCVLFDSAAPNVNPGAISRGTCMTDIWVYKTAPAIISGGREVIAVCRTAVFRLPHRALPKESSAKQSGCLCALRGQNEAQE